MTVPSTSLPAPVARYLTRAGLDGASVVPLTGDASDRRYFRVGHPTAASAIVALYAAPFEDASLPFLNVARLFAAAALPIPAVLDTAGDLGVVLLEDLGDTTLQTHIGDESASAYAVLYRQAADLVEMLQRRGAALESPEYLPFGLAFDVEKLSWELHFFVTHFLEGHRRAVLTPALRGALTEEMDAVVAELAAEPRVICHRDYHSRNLMWSGGRLHLIDFQDARMGPETYDLASLLRDAYVEVPDDLVDDILAHFLVTRGRANEDPSDFRRRFDLMTVQRTLKALGTFGFQASARGNPSYLPYVPRAIGYARRALAPYPRFDRLHGALAELVPEFA